MPHGEGVYFYRNGDVYYGMHDDGDYHGLGKFVCHRGTIYHGEWVKGSRTGKASFYDPVTQVITQGIWKDDTFVKYVNHKKASLATNESGEAHMKVSSMDKEGDQSQHLEEGFNWSTFTGIKKHVCGIDHKHGESCNHDHDHQHNESCNHHHEHKHREGESCTHNHGHKQREGESCQNHHGHQHSENCKHDEDHRQGEGCQADPNQSNSSLPDCCQHGICGSCKSAHKTDHSVESPPYHN